MAVGVRNMYACRFLFFFWDFFLFDEGGVGDIGGEGYIGVFEAMDGEDRAEDAFEK